MPIEQTHEETVRKDLKVQIRRQAITIQKQNETIAEFTRKFSCLYEKLETLQGAYDMLTANMQPTELATINRLSLANGRMVLEIRDLKTEYESLREMYEALNTQVIGDLDAEAEANRALKKEITGG